MNPQDKLYKIEKGVKNLLILKALKLFIYFKLNFQTGYFVIWTLELSQEEPAALQAALAFTLHSMLVGGTLLTFIFKSCSLYIQLNEYKTDPYFL